MFKKCLPAALLALAVAGAFSLPAARAASVVVTDVSNLLPNTANQIIHFSVSGNDAIAGAELTFQVNGGSTGPTLGGVDILSGIFASNNTGQTGPGVISAFGNHIAVAYVTTSTGTVAANGQFATVSVNTTGLSSGTFQLNILNTLNGNSDFVLSDGSTFSPTFPRFTFTINNPQRQWNVNSGGTWNDDGNWTPFAPFAAGDAANFLSAVSSPAATVNLDGNRTAGSVTFNNGTSSYTIAQGSGGALQLKGTSPFITNAGGNHTISAPLTLTANTPVTVTNSTDSLTITGPISGSFNLTLAGAGNLVLAGANAYAATTIGASATLQVGNGDGTGTLGTGAVSNSGLLAINRSGGFTLPNNISGTGSVANTGIGATSLTGTATYTGHTYAITGQLIFGGAHAHSIADVSGAGAVQVAAASSLISDGVVVSGLTINGTHTIRPNGTTAGTSKINSLTLAGTNNAWTGLLNLNDNALILQTADKSGTLATLQNQINAGSAGAVGITSGTALADPIHKAIFAVDNALIGLTSFGGLPVDANSVLVEATYRGDTNLDRKVNVTDLGVLATYYGQNVAGYGILRGDFNGDNVVNVSDLGILATDYGLGTAPGSTFSLEADLALTAFAAPVTSVPEPTALALLALGSAGLILRRKR